MPLHAMPGTHVTVPPRPVRYYGEWSHARRARARKSGSTAARPARSSETRHGCAHPGKRTWARLIKKVHEADPLLCPRCSRPLKIASLIDAPIIIERFLRHLKLWNRPERPPPAPPPRTLDYDLEIPAWEDDAGPFDGTE